MTSDDSSPKKKMTPSAITKKMRAIKAEKKAYLDSIPVEMQVKDTEHARSAEVLQYCLDQLEKGVEWAALRRKLGVGDASYDRRWRIIRESISDILVPSSEDEALKQRYSRGSILLEKLETLVSDIETRLEVGVNDKNEHNWYKIKLDSIKLLLENNEKEFEHYIEMKKAKVADGKTQGPSILIQNNYHLPRPGDNKLEGEVLEKAAQISREVVEVKRDE